VVPRLPGQQQISRHLGATSPSRFWRVGLTRRLTHFVTHHGLPLLFIAVMLESFGIPLPGETALIAFGVLASNGHYSIVSVIAVASVGAIVGDNLGFWLIGRTGGRALLHRWRWLGRFADRVLPRATTLMERHGGKAVFFGRFIAVVRFTIAWVAGLTGMSWARFLFWNALGGVVWATAVAVVAYYGGQAAASAIGRYGLYGAIAVVAVALAVAALVRVARSHLEKKLDA